MPPPRTLHALGSERGFCFVAEAHLWRANLSDPESYCSSLWKLLKAADLTVATASTLRELALKVPGGTPGRRAARFAKYGSEKTGLGARFRSSDVTQITVCRSRLVYTLRKIWEEAVRSPFDLLAIVLGLLLLVIIGELRCNCRPCLSRSSFWHRLFRFRGSVPGRRPKAASSGLSPWRRVSSGKT